MTLPYFELFRSVFESQYIGETALAALIICIIAIIFLMFMNVSKEAILLIPLPIFIALGTMANSAWIAVVAYIIAGVYFANILLSLGNRDK